MIFPRYYLRDFTSNRNKLVLFRKLSISALLQVPADLCGMYSFCDIQERKKEKTKNGKKNYVWGKSGHPNFYGGINTFDNCNASNP